MDSSLLDEFAQLFSDHYGVWGIGSGRVGDRIKLSSKRLLAFVPSDGWAAFARHNGKLVGYALGVRVALGGQTLVDWVTQLVVHGDHRKRGVASWLLFTFWGFSDHAAWGLVTSNPYAVRALERITHRRCELRRIHQAKDLLVEVGQRISYVVGRPIDFDGRSVIDTNFHISHRHLPKKLSDVQSNGVPWVLGNIREGEEWLAFTFCDQPQIPLNPEELKEMLNHSEQTARGAYERMALGPKHAWTRHTDAEVDFAVQELGLTRDAKVLDLGCGPGRHALRLAALGYEVVGVDFVPSFVDEARRAAATASLSNAHFVQGDARTYADGRGAFDGAICLYDVVGTFPEQEKNQDVLNNLVQLLAPGGRALLSVLNMELTDFIAKHRAIVEEDPDALQRLPPSRTMQQSGAIFDPEYFLLDPRTSIVYRKEQFDGDEQPPVEFVVRDRRYTRDDIARMCELAGAKILWARPVSLGHWSEELEGTAERAKEILFLIERPR